MSDRRDDESQFCIRPKIWSRKRLKDRLRKADKRGEDVVSHMSEVSQIQRWPQALPARKNTTTSLKTEQRVIISKATVPAGESPVESTVWEGGSDGRMSEFMRGEKEGRRGSGCEWGSESALGVDERPLDGAGESELLSEAEEVVDQRIRPDNGGASGFGNPAREPEAHGHGQLRARISGQGELGAITCWRARVGLSAFMREEADDGEGVRSGILLRPWSKLELDGSRGEKALPWCQDAALVAQQPNTMPTSVRHRFRHLLGHLAELPAGGSLSLGAIGCGGSTGGAVGVHEEADDVEVVRSGIPLRGMVDRSSSPTDRAARTTALEGYGTSDEHSIVTDWGNLTGTGNAEGGAATNGDRPE
ncbi:hypothetical protein C8R46DRAFT_1035858 [Mycena filopes]|nr:hypothetical protein C8R46DRAFT_1035858 [Mycena filopes]